MDSTRLKTNISYIIYKDDLPTLYDLGNFDKDNFICIGCSEKAIPASYKPDNLQRPHFRVKEHDKKCDINNYKELIKIGKKKKVSTSLGFPLPYPSKLYLQDKIKKVISNESIESDEDIKRVRGYTRNNEKKELNTYHQTTSSTIRPIVKHYLDFPFDRDIELNIPFLSDNLKMYDDYLKPISKYDIDINEFKSRYTEAKLYYVPLSVEKNNIIIDDEILILKLLCGNKDENFYLKMDISKWSNKKKHEVTDELEKESKKKIELYYENNKKSTKENIYLFFIGKLNENNPYEFQLMENDFRLYYATFTKIIYPKKKKRVYLKLYQSKKR